MIYRLIFISFIFLSIRLFAQNNPAEIIIHDIECKVDEIKKLTVTESLLIQINSPLGREHANIKIHYDNMSPIESIDVKIFNMQKELIKTFKKSEIDDISLLSGSFHTDDRYKVIKAYHGAYPYLIELKYIQIFDEYLTLPSWHPQDGKNIPLKKSAYKLTVPL